MPKKNHIPERINPTEEENNSLSTICEEVAKELNNFFANAVKNLNISNHEYYDYLAENIDYPTLKAIAKWRNHPSILAITSEYKNRAIFFQFCFQRRRSYRNKSAGCLEGHSGEWHSS